MGVRGGAASIDHRAQNKAELDANVETPTGGFTPVLEYRSIAGSTQLGPNIFWTLAVLQCAKGTGATGVNWLASRMLKFVEAAADEEGPVEIGEREHGHGGRRRRRGRHRLGREAVVRGGVVRRQGRAA